MKTFTMVISKWLRRLFFEIKESQSFFNLFLDFSDDFNDKDLDWGGEVERKNNFSNWVVCKNNSLQLLKMLWIRKKFTNEQIAK